MANLDGNVENRSVSAGGANAQPGMADTAGIADTMARGATGMAKTTTATSEPTVTPTRVVDVDSSGDSGSGGGGDGVDHGGSGDSNVGGVGVDHGGSGGDSNVGGGGGDGDGGDGGDGDGVNANLLGGATWWSDDDSDSLSNSLSDDWDNGNN